MQIARHDILSTRPSGMTPRRAAIIGTVALLHVGAAYMLVSGMAQHIIANVDHTLTVDLTERTVPPKPVPIPPTPVLAVPVEKQVYVPEPKFDIARDEPVIQATQHDPRPLQPTEPTALPVDRGAVAVAGTHTTPPYPALESRLGHTGTVTLTVMVAPDGNVASASVAQSSGFPELDQAAIAWVVGHWKYKPALESGNAVASRTLAAVKFDLTQAHR
ncbi:MAG: energy transducer TonB [Rhizomicrobium sp.]